MKKVSKKENIKKWWKKRKKKKKQHVLTISSIWNKMKEII
jgi:L-rhamnose mutarotase